MGGPLPNPPAGSSGRRGRTLRPAGQPSPGLPGHGRGREFESPAAGGSGPAATAGPDVVGLVPGPVALRSGPATATAAAATGGQRGPAAAATTQSRSGRTQAGLPLGPEQRTVASSVLALP